MTTEPDKLIEEVEELLAKATLPGNFAAEAEDLLRRLVEEVKRLREQRDRESTCIVCEALLLTSSEPPHCLDCYVTDEDRERWEAQS